MQHRCRERLQVPVPVAGVSAVRHGGRDAALEPVEKRGDEARCEEAMALSR